MKMSNVEFGFITHKKGFVCLGEAIWFNPREEIKTIHYFWSTVCPHHSSLIPFCIDCAFPRKTGLHLHLIYYHTAMVPWSWDDLKACYFENIIYEKQIINLTPGVSVMPVVLFMWIHNTYKWVLKFVSTWVGSSWVWSVISRRQIVWNVSTVCVKRGWQGINEKFSGYSVPAEGAL